MKGTVVAAALLAFVRASLKVTIYYIQRALLKLNHYTLHYHFLSLGRGLVCILALLVIVFGPECLDINGI